MYIIIYINVHLMANIQYFHTAFQTRSIRCYKFIRRMQKYYVMKGQALELAIMIIHDWSITINKYSCFSRIHLQ